jgi:hypothetical protein
LQKAFKVQQIPGTYGQSSVTEIRNRFEIANMYGGKTKKRRKREIELTQKKLELKNQQLLEKHL